MKALLTLAASFLLAGPMPVQTGQGTPYFAGMPPVRYQGEGVAIVAFVADVSPYCGTAPAGLVVIACTKQVNGRPVIIMPHPAPAGNDGDPYAIIMAHELGHAEGWASNHPL